VDSDDTDVHEGPSDPGAPGADVTSPAPAAETEGASLSPPAPAPAAEAEAGSAPSPAPVAEAEAGSAPSPAPVAEADAGSAPPPAPVAEAEARSAPPPAPPPAPDYPPPFATPPGGAAQAPKGHGRRNLAIALAVALVILIAGGIGANALLSSMYSPERAVTDYFAAQSRGDVTGMMTNATFQVGSDPDLFNKDGITAMMTVAQNKDVHNVKIVTSTATDSSTQAVAVTMTWAGKPHSETYAVKKDSSQTHDLIYHSWHVVIPFVTIQVTLPRQPGTIQVDGITSTSSDASTLQVAEGYHNVTMSSNFLYDATTQLVDGVDASPATTFAPSVSSSATAAIGTAVKTGFGVCDTSKYPDCMNYTYDAGPGYVWPWSLPGYGTVEGRTYRITFTADPTTSMKLIVSNTAGEVDAAGTCHVTMTFDGSRNYPLSGIWAAVVTWKNGAFTAAVNFDCLVTQG